VLTIAIPAARAARTPAAPSSSRTGGWVWTTSQGLRVTRIQGAGHPVVAQRRMASRAKITARARALSLESHRVPKSPIEFLYVRSSPTKYSGGEALGELRPTVHAGRATD